MNHKQFSSKGGIARKESLSQKQRTNIARKAAVARWKKNKGKQSVKKP